MFKVHITFEQSKTSGKTSIVLVTTDGHGGKTRKSLRLYFLTRPLTALEKQEKKDKILLAENIAKEEEKRLNSYGPYIPEKDYRGEDFIAYGQDFVEQLQITLQSKNKSLLVLKKLQKFFGKVRIPCFEITEVQLRRFAKSLEISYKGETAACMFVKLKQIIAAATSEGYFLKNPALGIKVKKSKYLIKAVLDQQELIALYKHDCGNDAVKRAFLFSANCTGLRWGDIQSLCWKDVKEDHIKVVQNKTKTLVSIPLNKDAVKLIGERGKPDQRVFDLPSYVVCLNLLKKWTKGAGINKHITFHCGRHSYGTNLIANNISICVASRLLSHASISTTERYVRVNEQLKQQAVELLPSITF